MILNTIATDPVETILSQFSAAFTVRDLMTPCENLERADSLEEGRTKSAKYGFDVIPHPRTGPITGFYHRRGEYTSLTPSDILSDGTSLLDLLSLLAHREFFFVLRSNEICGYVHFSDLSKSLLRTPIYMLLEATERHLLTVIRQSVSEEDMKTALGNDRVKALQTFLRRATAKRADTSLWDVLGLPDILTVAAAHDLTRVSETEKLTQEEKKEMIKIRNGVAHGALLLVESHDAVAKLVRLKYLCTQLRLLNGAEKKRKHMSVVP